MDLAYIVMSMLYVFLLVVGFILFALPAAAIAITLMGIVIGILKMGVLVFERMKKWLLK